MCIITQGSKWMKKTTPGCLLAWSIFPKPLHSQSRLKTNKADSSEMLETLPTWSSQISYLAILTFKFHAELPFPHPQSLCWGLQWSLCVLDGCTFHIRALGRWPTAAFSCPNFFHPALQLHMQSAGCCRRWVTSHPTLPIPSEISAMVWSSGSLGESPYEVFVDCIS